MNTSLKIAKETYLNLSVIYNLTYKFIAPHIDCEGYFLLYFIGKDVSKMTDNLTLNNHAKQRKKHPVNFGISISKVNRIINEWIINARHKEVAELRFCEGKTFEEIAELLDISTTSSKKIAYACESIILLHKDDK